MKVRQLDGRMSGPTMDRRGFVTGVAMGVAGVAGGAAWGFGPGADEVLLTRHDLVVPGLPPNLAGLTIAHVTDVHLPANEAASAHALGLLAAVKPAVTLFTGDIVEGRDGTEALVRFAERARGTVANYAVIGNWEQDRGVTPDMLRTLYQRAGVTYLHNERIELEVGGARLGIAGLDDPASGTPEPARVVPSGPRADVELCMVHAPAIADRLPEGWSSHCNLILAGHTHGGQIRIPFVPAILPRASGRFVSGWYRDADAPLYVSRGIGTTGLRARWRCPAELAVFTLRAG